MSNSVVFDLDGTLFQAVKTIKAAVDKLCVEMGLPFVDEGDIIKNIGLTALDFLRAILPGHIAPEAVRERSRVLERAEIRAGGELFPGVRGMLEELSRDYRLFVCSNGSEEYINCVLESTGVAGFFSGLYSGSGCASKGDALGQLIRENPDSPVLAMVGDAPTDLDAARRNNVPFIAAGYGYGCGYAGDMNGAGVKAQSPGEITGHVRRFCVFSRICGKIAADNCRVVGINGADTSGKTVFAVDFARYLAEIGVKTEILHIDDFHNPLAMRRSGANENEAYYENAFNYGRVITEILEPLRETGELDKDVLCLNLDTDKYENTVHFRADKDTVLLVEGVLLYRPPLDGYFDCKVFLSVDFDEIIRRAAARDVPKYGDGILDKYYNKYIPLQKRYFEEFHPKRHSDFVVDNNNFDCPRLTKQI